MADVDEILASLDTFEQAFCAGDADTLMALFDEDAAISLIGNGKDGLVLERRKIRAYFKRSFKTDAAGRFEWHRRHVTVSGNAAVVAATLTIHPAAPGEKPPVPEPWTVALVRRGSGWKWLHQNASHAGAGRPEPAADERR